MSLTLNITYNKTKLFNFLLISTFYSGRLISYLRKFLTMHFKQSHLHPKHSPQMSYDREYPQHMYLCSYMYYFSSKVSTGFFQKFSITRTAFIDWSFKASWLRIIKGFLIFFHLLPLNTTKYDKTLKNITILIITNRNLMKYVPLREKS